MVKTNIYFYPHMGAKIASKRTYLIVEFYKA